MAASGWHHGCIRLASGWHQAGIMVGIRTLHFLAALCSPPPTLHCLFGLGSVNWLQQKRRAYIRTQGCSTLLRCSTVSHWQPITYVQYHKKEVSSYTHTLMLSAWSISGQQLHTPHTASTVLKAESRKVAEFLMPHCPIELESTVCNSILLAFHLKKTWFMVSEGTEDIFSAYSLAQSKETFMF